MELLKKRCLVLEQTLIISNDEMGDILKIVKSLEDSGILLKGVSETIQHEAKFDGTIKKKMLGSGANLNNFK